MHLSSLFRPKVWTLFMLLRKPGRLLSDKNFLKSKYWASTGKKLNLDNPESFNEKLQWLKLNNRRPEYTTMADKYAVREYVKKTIGEEYLIPLLGVWCRPKDIDFDLLPKQFVLKCNHDSGSVIICHDKCAFDRDAAIKSLNKFLEKNYYWQGREWPYKNITPVIIAEEYLVDESNVELKDYKVFNFNGIPKIIQVDFDRFGNHRRNLYSVNWKYLGYTSQYPTDPSVVIKQPMQLEKLLDCAKRLSSGIPFVRTDFYSVNEKIFFGEMTFYHGGGMERFYPEEWDLRLGSWIKLPEGNS